MNTKKFRSVISLILSILIAFSSVPIFPFEKDQVVRADTLLDLEPTEFSNVYGGEVAVQFEYEDKPHPTEVKVVNPIQYLIKSGTYVDNEKHIVYWNGKDSKGLVKANTYTIKAGPTDEDSKFAKEADVKIFNPNPPAPKYINAVPNIESSTHVIRGISEKDTKVTLTIKYEVRKDGNQFIDDSLTEVYENIQVSNNRTWSKDSKYAISDYFTNFPERTNNKPEQYVGEWEKEITLKPYAIAHITATTKRDFDGKISGSSEVYKVLRYVAPDDERRWAVIASYYYNLNNTKEEIEEKLHKIVPFNGLPQENCVDGNPCYGQLFDDENVLLEDPINAGIIYKDIASRIEDEFANKNGYPIADAFDPINLATGDFDFYHTNMSLQAKMPLEFAVTYRSKNKYDGDIGVGWSHSFEYRIQKLKDGNVYLKTPSGASHKYLSTGKGEFLTPPGVYETLKQNTDKTYTLETLDETQYQFRQDGNLYKIIDANGNTTTLQYFGSLLEKVSTEGASMSFTYGKAGKIVKVTDHTGRTIEYDYDPTTFTLKSIQLPDKATIKFDYDEKLRMTQIHNPNETASLINEYDDKDRVIKQRDFSGKWGLIEYYQEQNKTTITDQRGNQTTYEYDHRYRKTAMHYPDGTSEKFAYDGNDNLTKYTDRNGQISEFIYDGKGNLLQSIDPLRNITTIEYNEFNKPTKIVDPLKNETNISYDKKGNIISIKNPLGETTTFQRDSYGIPTSMVNSLGETVTLENDQYGFVQFIIDPVGNRQELNRDSLHRVTKMVNALGHATEIEYDPRDRVVTQKDALNYTENFKYDKNSNLTNYIDPVNGEKEYRYDSFDRLIAIKDALGNVTQYQYDEAGNLSKQIEANGAVTSYEYNNVNHLVKMIDPEGNATLFTYDGNGNVLSVTNPEGGIMTATYDARNLPITITDASGAKTSYEYDALGRLVKETNSLDHHTSYEYDLAGRVIKITDALGYETEFEYDKAGQLIKTIKPNGAVWKMNYDRRGLLTEMIDPLGNVQEIKRDALGQITTLVDEVGAKTNYSYDALGQVIKIENALGYSTKFNYDPRGLMTGIEDEKGQRTTYDYDALGRLHEVINALNQRTQYSYDSVGNIIGKTDAKGHTTTYAYDLNNQLIKEINPLEEITGFSYDGNGNITSILYPDGIATKYSYDLVDRLTNIEFGDGKAVAYSYDVLGRRTNMTDWNGVTSYRYDALDRLIEVTDTFGQMIQYEWTPTGQRSKMTYPDTSSVSYEYDVKDQLTKVIDDQGRVTTYNYDPRGALIEKALPTGAISKYEYDALGQVLGIRHENQYGEAVDQFLYAYDPVGNRIQTERIEDSDDEEKETIVTEYAYDALNQLTKVQNQNKYDPLSLVTTNYSYDEVGNRLSKESSWGSLTSLETYVYDQADKLIKWQSGSEYKEYAYDPRGNLLTVTGTVDELSEIDVIDPLEEVELFLPEQPEDTEEEELSSPTLPENNIEVEELPLDSEKENNGEETKDSNENEENEETNESEETEENNSTEAGTELTEDEEANALLVVQGIEATEETEEEAAEVEPQENNETKESKQPENNKNNKKTEGADKAEKDEDGEEANENDKLVPEALEQYEWDAANRLIKQINALGDVSTYTYNGDGDRIKMTVDIKNGPDGRGNGKGNGNGNGNNNGNPDPNCHSVPPGFVPPGLAKKCGYEEEPFPDNEKGGPRDGWEPQFKKKQWEFHYTNDVSLALPEPIQITEADPTKWKQTFVYGHPNERLSMTFLPAYDDDNGWEPYPGAGGAEPGVPPKSLWYLTDALGSTTALLEKDGRVSARYHYDEFGIPLDGKQFDVNWPGPDNLFGYTGLGYDYYSELTYARARYYKPEIGRFISQDPYKGDLWNSQSQNQYVYVENNPILYVDPSGHMKWYQGRHLGLGVYDSLEETFKEFLNWDTYEGLKDFGKALFNNQITAKEILKALGHSAKQKVEYFTKNTKHIFAGTPTNQEVRKYGKEMGDILLMIGGNAAAAKLVTKVAPKLVKALKKIGGCNCFTAGTKVLTDEGEKNIEDIEVGDKVLAKDENNPDEELAYKEVTALYRNQRDDIIKLHVGEQIIETTDNHPFWVEGKGWVFADELQVGDKLQKADGSNLTIDKIEFVELDKTVTVYNFTVADFHTYYVTDLGIWVHNTNCPKGIGKVPSKSNYRSLYLDKNPGLPKGWQVHHTLPQKYQGIMKNAGINIHEVKYLRGVDPKVHSKITNEWTKWDKSLGRTPTAQEIRNFAKQIDQKYNKYWH